MSWTTNSGKQPGIPTSPAGYCLGDTLRLKKSTARSRYFKIRNISLVKTFYSYDLSYWDEKARREDHIQISEKRMNPRAALSIEDFMPANGVDRLLDLL